MQIFCYQHHINDFRRDTAHLSHEQKGVYRDLLDFYYLTGGKLPNDIEALGRMIGTQTNNERSCLLHIVANFFTVRNHRLFHKRCEQEMVKIRQKSIAAKQSAKAMWLKKKEEEASVRSANAYANDMLTKNQEPRTKNHTTVLTERGKNGRQTGSSEGERIAKKYKEFGSFN